MRNIALKLFHSNLVLRDRYRTAAALRRSADKRGLVKIAVIDDEPFKPQLGLERYGYNFTLLGDLRDVKQTQPYHMVLCDIIGVGKYFDQSRQGASIIAEIKNNYPEKIVVAYTGNATSDPSIRMAAERADEIINKDVDNEEWIERLDNLSALATDPYLVWSRVRSRLVALEVDSKDILFLEDGYVRSVLAGDQGVTELKRATDNNWIRDDAKAIVLNLISSGLFAAFGGAN